LWGASDAPNLAQLRFGRLTMETFSFKPIGIIFTPYQDPQRTPIQAAASLGVQGRIQIFPEYQESLQDLEGFSHLILIYVFPFAGIILCK